MSQFQRAYLSYIARSTSAQGFTLIELLVTVLIIGILSAIALPSMLNQANRAREAEAKNYVGAVTRAQQAYRLQNPTFAPTMNDLQIKVPDQSNSYNYAFDSVGVALAQYKASPTQAGLRAFTGCTIVVSGALTDTKILETQPVGETIADPPTTCP
ncbi:MAG: prepilin-type N-terminal cleavage/methylation domain-containing protein [Aphanocapsa sp. GSE-SYN-MK-11-07L]|jgi:type IV pilus assembly protein PilA|nr:prepilin-type N-terminal cleavage/methylation domain-containing protein [Aphanocapsa sp. GSE-SYN-MK-11-07L]